MSEHDGENMTPDSTQQPNAISLFMEVLMAEMQRMMTKEMEVVHQGLYQVQEESQQRKTNECGSRRTRGENQWENDDEDNDYYYRDEPSIKLKNYV